MDALTPIAVQAIAGLIGGGIAGNLIDAAAIRTAPKVVASLLGGIAGGTLAGLALGVGQIAMVPPDPAVTADLTTRMNFPAIAAWVSGALFGGGLLTATSGALGLGR